MWSLTKCQLNFVHISFSGKTSVSKRDIPVVSILCLSQVIYQMRKTMKLSISVLKLSVMVLTSKRLFLHPCIMILLINATYYSVLQGLTFVTFQRVAASSYRSNHSCSVFSNVSNCKTFMVFYGLLNCAENSMTVCTFTKARTWDRSLHFLYHLVR